MVSKKEMLKVLTKAKLLAAARKRRIKVAKSWTKGKIATALPFDVIRSAYSSMKKPAKKKKVVRKKKPVRRKKAVKRKKPAKKKKVVRKKKPVRRKKAVKRRR
jgi:hypothetical protein